MTFGDQVEVWLDAGGRWAVTRHRHITHIVMAHMSANVAAGKKRYGYCKYSGQRAYNMRTNQCQPLRYVQASWQREEMFHNSGIARGPTTLPSRSSVVPHRLVCLRRCKCLLLKCPREGSPLCSIPHGLLRSGVAEKGRVGATYHRWRPQEC